MSRAAAVAAVTVVLIFFGTYDASESARQLNEASRAARIAPNDAGVTAVGTLASAAALVALGAWLGDDRPAVRLGALAGALAGLVGGTIRAFIIAAPLTGVIVRYAALPDQFVWAVLAIFVALSCAVTIVAGAALAFAGVRLRRWRAREGR